MTTLDFIVIPVVAAIMTFMSYRVGEAEGKRSAKEEYYAKFKIHHDKLMADLLEAQMLIQEQAALIRSEISDRILH